MYGPRLTNGYDYVLLQDAPRGTAITEEQWLLPLGYAPVARSDLLLLLGREGASG